MSKQNGGTPRPNQPAARFGLDDVRYDTFANTSAAIRLVPRTVIGLSPDLKVAQLNTSLLGQNYAVSIDVLL